MPCHGVTRRRFYKPDKWRCKIAVSPE
ncbi:protein of unknown function [Weissella viridescens]|nr:protein of unknown function [Weissella viridescens]